MTNQTQIAGCGHTYPLPAPGGGASGYATLPDGSTVCYGCADEIARHELVGATVTVGYLTGSDASRDVAITTWSGGKLADVTSHVRRTMRGFGGTHTRIYFRATDVHGCAWAGSSPGFGMIARMRRVAAR